jgi:DNA-directed RNA polymerase II subunit RPB1
MIILIINIIKNAKRPCVVNTFKSNMCKRFLTDDELEYITDFLQLDESYNFDHAIERFNYIKNKIINSLKKTQIYVYNNDVINKIKNKIQKHYFDSKLNPGMMVGAIAAGSLGEPSTQMVLNSFHTSGTSNVTSVSGITRLEELMSATKKPKKTSLSFELLIDDNIKYYINLLKTSDTIDNKLKYIKHIRDVSRKEFEERFIYDLLKKTPEIYFNRYNELSEFDAKWYYVFDKLFHNNYKSVDENNNYNYSWSFRLEFDIQHIYDYKLNLQSISQKIQQYLDLICVFSPNHIGIIDVYVYTNCLKNPIDILNREKKIINTQTENFNNFCDNIQYYYIRDVVINYVNFIKITGIESIDNLYFTEKKINDNLIFEIQTNGSNLKQVIKHPLVDYKSISTNFCWEALNVLGIEACRNVLKNELIKTFSAGGITINECQFNLLVDCMTYKATINPASRYGNDDIGPLTRSSFEMSSINMINASKYNERDDIKGVSSNIIVGKLSKVGTGYMDLFPNIKMISQNLLQPINENNEIEYVEY